MRKRKNTGVAKKFVDKEIIEIDSDSDDSGGRILAICGEVNALCQLPNTLAVYGETNRTSTQIVCADDCAPGLNYDLDYQKFLAICGENRSPYLLEDRARDSFPMLLMYNVDRAVKNEKKKNVVKRASDSSKRRVVKKEKSRPGRKPKPPVVSNVSKRLKTENGRVDLKSSSRTVVRTKDAKPKKLEVLRGRKIPKTKNNVISTSTTDVKGSLTYNFKACKKKNEERLSSVDKSYTYYLAYLRNSVTIYASNRQQVKRENDRACFSDRDLIISDHPFADAPFETNKGDKVIDLEDGIELGDLFNSMFSKKLMEVLRKPYDKNELSKLYKEVSRKRPLTRSRQLRDGKEIEYKVYEELRPSYLQQFPDFSKMYRHCVKKDRPRGLNLLRGFFFYLENIIHEGAFKPWRHEKCLRKMCSNGS